MKSLFYNRYYLVRNITNKFSDNLSQKIIIKGTNYHAHDKQFQSGIAR